MGENGVAETAGDTAGEAEGDLLAANGFLAVGEMAMGGDPGAERGLLVADDLHEDRAAGVLAGEIADDARVFQQASFSLGIDDEVHQRRVGARVVLLPQRAQLVVDLGNGDFFPELCVFVCQGGCHFSQLYMSLRWPMRMTRITSSWFSTP